MVFVKLPCCLLAFDNDHGRVILTCLWLQLSSHKMAFQQIPHMKFPILFEPEVTFCDKCLLLSRKR